MRLICVGDVAIGGLIKDKSPWPRPLSYVTKGEESCVLFNWELPCGERCVSTPRSSGGIRLVAPLDSVEFLRHWVPAVAALANNHLTDAGAAGAAQTIAALSRIGIPAFGGGTTQDADRPWIWETGEGRVGVCNWVTAETHPDAPNS